MKKILKFILYAGAILCCLAGLMAIWVVITSAREPYDQAYWPCQLAFALIYIGLAFTPALMFMAGIRTKTWHWLVTGVAEVIVIAIPLYGLLLLISLSFAFHR